MAVEYCMAREYRMAGESCMTREFRIPGRLVRKLIFHKV